MNNLVHFFTTNAGFAAAFSAVATITATVLGQVLRGSVRLIWFSPQSTNFTLKGDAPDAPIVQINSGQIVIQNFGRKSAKNVQVTSVPGNPIASYAIIPSLVHTTKYGPKGEWIVEIPYIAKEEVVTIQILNGPLIASVRSDEGAGKLVPVIHQRLFPKHIQFAIGLLMLVGLLAIFYAAGWIISHA